MQKDWYLNKQGVHLHIDSSQFPDEEEIAFDVETDENDNPICVGLCGNSREVYVYFNLDQRLWDYLKTRKLVAHNAKADISWLEKYGIKMNVISYDTMLAAYVLCSTEMQFGLKHLAKKYLSLEWPSYKDITSNKDFLLEACLADAKLYILKTKTYKKKESITSHALPKRIPLYQHPKETIANYNGMDVYATYMLKKNQERRTTPTAKAFMEKIEFPTSEVLYEMEKKGIKVNIEKLLTTHKKFLKKMYRAKKLFHSFVGKDVLVSSPVQVLSALKKLGIKVTSTNENILMNVRHHRVVKLLLAYRGYAKICNTYTKPLYKMGISAPDNRIHCSFIQHTSTGRLACRNPNLENQPPELRDCFEAENGHTFVDSDFSQIELRVPAHFSQDPVMVDGFLNPKEKFHAITARKIGQSYHVGKTVNFLLTNGGGPERLSQISGISLEKATEAFEMHHKEFKGYWDWTKNEVRLARAARGVTTLYGRFIPIPELRDENWKIRSYAERFVISGKVQGSAADIMKASMIRLYRKYSIIGVNVIHDELLVETSIGNAKDVEHKIGEVMSNVVKLRVPIVADIGVGLSWASAKDKE